jgi:cyclic pyranopterin monophosphate synthase
MTPMADAHTSSLTHLDAAGGPRMVDVSEKQATVREAAAEGRLHLSGAALDALRAGAGPKGDVLTVARLAGIQAAKRTADLIPLCHPIPLTGVVVEVEVEEELPALRVIAVARVTGPTGVEMEALTAVAGALLTAYDMLKAIDRGMRIDGIRLLRKSGGRSGAWSAEDATRSGAGS